MHIPDNYLSPETDAVAAVAMVPVWAHCVRHVSRSLDRRQMSFLGICAAFSFLLMMFNVPLPGGTTGHAVGGALVALLLGPEAACIAVSVALGLQALLFGDGGVLSFGANCLNMAFVLPFVAAFVFRAVRPHVAGKPWGTSFAAVLCGWCGLCAAALCAAIEFGVQPLLFCDAAGSPLYCPFPLSVSIPAMMLPHMLVAGFVEGFSCAAIYAFVKRVAPEVIAGPEASALDETGVVAQQGGVAAASPAASSEPTTAPARKSSLVPVALLLAVLVAATPLGLLATGTAWGEWDAADAAEEVAATGDASIHESVGLDASTFSDGLVTGDYLQSFAEEAGLGFGGQAALYVVSAVVGACVLVIAFRFASFGVRDRVSRT